MTTLHGRADHASNAMEDNFWRSRSETEGAPGPRVVPHRRASPLKSNVLGPSVGRFRGFTRGLPVESVGSGEVLSVDQSAVSCVEDIWSFSSDLVPGISVSDIDNIGRRADHLSNPTWLER